MSMTFAIPTIRTERLALRAARQSDFDAYAVYRGGARARFIGGPNTPREAYIRLGYETGLWALRGYGGLIVADASDDAPIGLAGFYHHANWNGPELGWGLFDGYEGRGYATEAARALCRFAFDTLDWASVDCSVANDNDRSIALVNRLGGVPASGSGADGILRFSISREAVR